MVIQNVSTAPVRLVADATAPNPRELTLMSRKHGWVHSRTQVEEPSDVDFLLQPGDVAVLDMLPQKGPQGSSISRNLDVVFFGKMSIEKTPPGAWTGTLVTAGMQAFFCSTWFVAETQRRASCVHHLESGHSLGQDVSWWAYWAARRKFENVYG